MERDWRILIAHQHGATFVDIARKLGITPVRVRQLFYRAQRRAAERQAILMLSETVIVKDALAGFNRRCQSKQIMRRYPTNRDLAQALSLTLDGLFQCIDPGAASTAAGGAHRPPA